MTEIATKTVSDFVLPPSVVSKLDVSRMVREVEQIDSELTAVAVRAKSGAAAAPKFVLSEQLTDFLQLNTISITPDGNARAELIKQLRALKDKAPVIHMTFAVSADRESLSQIAHWLRESVHPQAVISVGLQPALVAGVYMRTPNKVFDLSLRGALSGQHGALVKELEAYRGRR